MDLDQEQQEYFDVLRKGMKEFVCTDRKAATNHIRALLKEAGVEKKVLYYDEMALVNRGEMILNGYNRTDYTNIRLSPYTLASTSDDSYLNETLSRDSFMNDYVASHEQAIRKMAEYPGKVCKSFSDKYIEAANSVAFVDSSRHYKNAYELLARGFGDTKGFVIPEYRMDGSYNTLAQYSIARWMIEQVVDGTMMYSFLKQCMAVSQWVMNCYTMGIGGITETKDAVYWYPRPIIRVDDGLIHSKAEVAVAMPEGFGVHALRGIMVDERTWKQVSTGKIKAKNVIKAKNAEMKRAILETMGYDWALKALKGKKIASKEVKGITKGNQTFEVWEVDLNDDDTLARLVAVTCPSTGRRYVLRVDPRNEETKDIDGAIAWTFEKTKEEFTKNIKKQT